jgi:hypothetical protein
MAQADSKLGHQVVVSDVGGRTRPTPKDVPPGAPVVDGGAGRLEHPTDRDQGHGELSGYLGRFAGGIWGPLFQAAALRISFSKVSSPTLCSASRSRRSSGSVGWPRRPFRVFLPPLRNSSRQAMGLPAHLSAERLEWVSALCADEKVASHRRCWATQGRTGRPCPEDVSGRWA